MGEWYVAFVNSRAIETHTASDRAAAINEACELLKQGIDVREVAPAAAAAGTPLDADDIFEIFERRGRLGRLPL
jgi:hypothetical protein